MTLISQCDSIVFAVAQRRLESESLCNSEDLVYSIFGWNNSKEFNFHNEKSSWHDTECVIRFYLLSRLRDCTTKSNLVSFENDEIKWKKFLTISKRCCKIHIAVAKSDKKQSAKAKSFLLVRKQEIKKISKILFFERFQKIK